MIMKVNSNKLRDIAGGVRQLRERKYTGDYGFILENPEEMAAYADYLEDRYRNESWQDEEGVTWNGKSLADDWRNEFKNKKKEYFFFHDGIDVYNDFKNYCNRKNLGIKFKDL